MNEEQWKQFIQKTKEDYYKIGHIPCPAFGGELVYFNRLGCITITKYYTHTMEIQGKSVAYFWSFINIKSEEKITVIIRQLKGGLKHFFSIFDR